MKNRKRSWIVILAVALYVLLLFILTAVESGAPDSSIHSLWDALWYSIITITTVGYGDMAPVTAAGKVLGILFAFCSIGLLTALISLGISTLRGETLPKRRLRAARGRKWYWFSDRNPDSTALADSIRQEDPDSITIFPQGNGNSRIEHGSIYLDAGLEEVIGIRENKDGLVAFYTGEDPWKNSADAVKAASLGIPVYSLSDCIPDDIPENLRLFSMADAVSRSYWKKYPLRISEKTIALIGCGKAGSELLTRALLTNVFDREHTVEYHVFGNCSEYAALHPEIIKALTPEAPEEDSLFLHEEDWSAATDILAAADRIIICEDNDQADLDIYGQLRKWFPVAGAVHVRLYTEFPGICSFGSREESLVPEFVMRDSVNRMAVLINDLYNENSDRPVAWRDLSEFIRQSNIAAADHVPVKVRWLLGDDAELTADTCRQAYEVFCAATPQQREVCREIEHRRWLRFQRMYNWKAAEVRNNDLRLHNAMLPYDQLDEAEHRKDDYAWEMLGHIAGKIRE